MRPLLHRIDHHPLSTVAPRDRHLFAVTSLESARAPEALVREAGGPEDRARYACGCGFVFRAAVSTSVTCPHCGTGQDW